MHNSEFQKHIDLEKWKTCQTIANELKKSKPDHLKKNQATQGVRFLKILEKNQFFTTYPRFYSEYILLSDSFDIYVIGVEENIKLVSAFFSWSILRPVFSVFFSQKSVFFRLLHLTSEHC